jgi:hypothetical protein
LCEVAGLEAGLADVDDFVVVVEVGLGEFEDGLGLEGVDEGQAEVKFKIAPEVFVLVRGDAGGVFGGFEAEFSFPVALVEVAESVLNLGGGKWLPSAIVGNQLSAVGGQGVLGIGTEEGGSFLGLAFVDAEGVGFEGGVCCLKAGLDVVPGQGLLPTSGDGGKAQEQGGGHTQSAEVLLHAKTS